MDEINQIGKYLKETDTRTKAVLSRYIQPRARVERTRDVFDPTLSFEMEFNTDRVDQLVRLDLFFQEAIGTTPSNSGGGGSNCANGVCPKCETITITTSDSPTVVPPDSLITTSNNIYYISPSGNDTSGDGSISNPWFSIQRFIDQAPSAGSALYCRDGRYNGTTLSYSGYSGHPSLIGTSGSPITIRAYPGETPIFPVSAGAIQFRTTTAYVIIDGLQFVASPFIQTGVIYMGGQTDVDQTHHITVRNCQITLSGTFADATSHAIYISSGTNYITIEQNLLIGPGANNKAGWGVHMYHTPGPTVLTTRNNIFVDWQNPDGGGVTYWDDACGGSITHNTFINCARNIDAERHVTLLIRDNAGETAISGATYNLYDPNNSGYTTADHNYWGENFDSNYALVSPSSAINGASDGTNAGASTTPIPDPSPIYGPTTNSLIITLTHPYIAGSVKAYLNGQSASVTEISPIEATVMVNEVLVAGDILVICYDYNSGGTPPDPEEHCCGEYIDNFDRTASSDWGTNSFGYWFNGGPGAWGYSVIGGKAHAVMTSYAGGQGDSNFRTADINDLAYPYWTMPQDFRFITKFNVNISRLLILLGIDFYENSDHGYSGGISGIEMAYNWQGNSIGIRDNGGSYSEVGRTLSAGTDYILMWERVRGQYNRMKVWPASSAEPLNWDIEQSASSNTPERLKFSLVTDTGNVDVAFDYMIIQRLGTNCSETCTGFTGSTSNCTTDSFAGRTASAPAGAPGYEVFGDFWGTSDLGSTYSFQNIITVPLAAGDQSSNAYIQNGIAVLECPETSDPSAAGSFADVYLNNIPVGSDFDITMKIRWTTTTFSSDAGPWARISFSTPAGFRNIVYNFYSSSPSLGASSGPCIAVEAGYPFTYSAYNHDPSNEGWVWVRWINSSSDKKMYFKQWVVGTAEPSWQAILDTTNQPEWTSTSSTWSVELVPGQGSTGGWGQLKFEISCLEIKSGFTVLDSFNRNLCVDDINFTIGYSESPVAQWYASGSEWCVDGSSLVMDPANLYGGATVHIPMYSARVGMPWESDHFTMQLRFKMVVPGGSFVGGYGFYLTWVANAESPNTAGWIFVWFEEDASPDPLSYIFLRSWNGSTYSNSNSYYHDTQQNNTWFILKLEKTTSSLVRVKIWKDGDTEPDWQDSLQSYAWNPNMMEIGASDMYFTDNGILYIDYISFSDSSE